MTPAGRELLARCEGAWNAARRSWGKRLFGLPGNRGPVLAATQSTGQADYATGDDFRNVDWQRAARHDELVTRLHRGVETGTVQLVLDRSRSMGIGTPSKFTLAQELAVVLGYWALAAGRSVQCSPVGSAGAAGTLLCGRRMASRLLAALQAQTAEQEDDFFYGDLASVGRRLRRGDVAVVLSDLLHAEGIARLAAPFARPAEQLLIVQVLAAEDLEPTWLDGVATRSIEAGSTMKLDLTVADLARYRAAAAEWCRQTRNACQARGIPLVQLRSDVGFDPAMEYLIHILAGYRGARR